jgi:hypothetical protein
MARTTLRQRLRETWQKLSRLDARPDQIATGFTIGVIAGLLPLNPSPIVVATAAAWLLKRNVVAAVAGATAAMLYIPLLPLIWLVEYRLGAFILQVQHPLTLDHARLWDVFEKGWDVYAAMLIGSIVIAVPVTFLTYFVIKRLAESWARKRNRSKHSD